MRRGVVLALLLALGGISMLAAGFQNPPAGNGGNTAVFVTDGGVVVVDTKNPGKATFSSLMMS